MGASGESGADGRGGDSGRSGEMTLVFTLPAIQRFADPATVFAEARTWSRHVGVVDNDTEAVTAFVDEHGLQQDFDLGEADKWLAMEQIRGATATPRHVFVGTSVEDQRIATQLGWEYRTPGAVAEKADWTLAGEASASGEGSGLVASIRRLLPGGSS